jgi:RHS repeat-associated protein
MQAVLAQDAGVSRAKLAAIVKDGAVPSPDLLGKLAPALDIHTADLFVIAGLPVPDDIGSAWPTSPWDVGSILRVAVDFGAEQRSRLKTLVRSLPVQPRAAPAQARTRAPGAGTPTGSPCAARTRSRTTPSGHPDGADPAGAGYTARPRSRPPKKRDDPFANPRDTAVLPSDRGFVSGTNDTTTGLTHLGARDYDPVLGRFVSTDPLITPSDPATFNPYAYGEDNPATLSDPSGRAVTHQCPDGDVYGEVVQTGGTINGNVHSNLVIQAGRISGGVRFEDGSGFDGDLCSESCTVVNRIGPH